MPTIDYTILFSTSKASQRSRTSFLTEEEITTIYLKEFSADRLNQVKDAFIFCCFAYIDVFQLKKSNVEMGIDGWFARIAKTDTPSEFLCYLRKLSRNKASSTMRK
jgi:hypothetical protein